MCEEGENPHMHLRARSASPSSVYRDRWLAGCSCGGDLAYGDEPGGFSNEILDVSCDN